MLCQQIKKNKKSAQTTLSRKRRLFSVPRPRLEALEAAAEKERWKSDQFIDNEDISHVSDILYHFFC